MGHGTMDLYPTFLTTQRNLNVLDETWMTIILQIGGILGCVVGEHLSHTYSARWVAAANILLIAAWLPLWVLPTTWNKLTIGAFFLELFYGCAIGNLVNLMQQLCPHPGRTTISRTDNRKVIGLLLITLISMSLKSLNKEWDEKDPNAAISTAPIQNDYETKNIKIGEQDLSGSSKSEGRETQTVHIEETEGYIDSITKKL
ncbi:hypothetical protein UA08_06324 [Talaromyces atroroseus]|uniref:Major facilitator superfamily (MFS) profile domain-containing protein n=1 Tax=Talaromyces atroroseus TaxID=1441469 RepID=A0A225AC89_TALAT|nr:hypothetical protein UA08_06324 [Talaromyces atroroseus]OKL58731.1 hypothetical protein UA08_06324 [Talaromyces atroroseus]